MEQKIQSLVFDLDGTLMMSSQTIYKATVKALEDFNILHEITHEKFTTKIGYHFKDIFDHFNIEVNDLEEFIDIYKSYYFDFIDDSYFFPNVLDVLEELSKKYPVSLLTTKAQDQTDKIIDHFGVRKYFNIIKGRRIGIPIKPAPDTLLQICKELNIAPVNTLMIGDTELDIKCGKNAGALTCAVSYGFRTINDLQHEHPDFIIPDIKDLLQLLDENQ